MRLTRFFITILFFILTLSCNSKENDQIIKPINLIKSESVILEENEDVIISDIIDCDINGECGSIVITSGISQIIAIYDFKSGKLINAYKAGIYLSDSIKNSNRIPPSNPFNDIPLYPIKYLSLEECKKNGITDLKMIRNEFIEVEYKNDNSISTLALIYLPTLLKDNLKTAYNTAAVVEFDTSLNIKKVIFPNNTLFNFTLSNSFAVDNLKRHFYILNQTLLRYKYLKLKDSLPVLSVYDEKGEFIKTALFLDEKFANDEFINLSFMYNPITTTFNHQLFTMFPYDPNTVYNLTTNDTICLSNPIVDYSKKYEEARNRLNTLERNSNETKVIEEFFPLTVCNVTNNGTNLIICFLKKGKESNSFIFREYDTNGKLISERTFENKDNLNIQNMLYDKKNNYVVFFVKGEENWTMEKFRW
ncbi:MAG TPA: hypothetical protein PKY56_03420 [Candidatus Kapabacteria bacterium]|nr:hypothetical protein [Candidatus Kapabacteria bacterium]HPO63185.1 hypothetical protein [Candidatus Kapabacteria bacterium]